jgi:hypothetical protein
MEMHLWINTFISAATLIALIAIYLYQKSRLKDYDRFVKIFDLDKLERYGKVNDELFAKEKKIIEADYSLIIKDKDKNYAKLLKVSNDLFKLYKFQNEEIANLKAQQDMLINAVNPRLKPFYENLLKNKNP